MRGIIGQGAADPQQLVVSVTALITALTGLLVAVRALAEILRTQRIVTAQHEETRAEVGKLNGHGDASLPATATPDGPGLPEGGVSSLGPPPTQPR